TRASWRPRSMPPSGCRASRLKVTPVERLEQQANGITPRSFPRRRESSPLRKTPYVLGPRFRGDERMEAKASDPGNMAVRFDDIGNRLKAFRLGSGLSADEIASRLGISRTALYRFEKGELAKIETLEKLAELLGVSVPTLLGVGVEYIGSAVAYFERMRQIEETSEHIIVLAGPISYLLSSDAFD